MSFPDRPPSLSDLTELDWDFADTTTASPFAQFHWHPARFPPQIPAVAIGVLSEPGELVLDPFAGCGTTLVEAARQDRRSVGIDSNPVATLMTSAKVSDGDVVELERAAKALLSRVEQSVATGATEREIPNRAEQALWYEPRTLVELGHIWYEINEVPDPDHRLAFTASFSAILRFVCSQEQHWGWICDNVKPKRLIHRSAVSKFADKVSDYVSAARFLRPPAGLPESTVLTGSCLEHLGALEDASVDLVVTSPPYFGMTDYAKAQRLTCLWLGIEVEPVRRDEIGARSKRHRQTAADQYLAEIADVFAQIGRVLKPGRNAIVVIGESTRRAPILTEVADGLSLVGLTMAQEIHRRLPTQRGKNASLSSEHVWILSRD